LGQDRPADFIDADNVEPVLSEVNAENLDYCAHGWMDSPRFLTATASLKVGQTIPLINVRHYDTHFQWAG
jgi:hypothetical protein